MNQRKSRPQCGGGLPQGASERPCPKSTAQIMDVPDTSDCNASSLTGPGSVASGARDWPRRRHLVVVMTVGIVAALLVGFAAGILLPTHLERAPDAAATRQGTVAADRRLSTAQRLRAEGRYSAALDAVQEYLDGGQAGAGARLLRATLLLDLERREEASAELAELVDGPPDVAGTAHGLLAGIYMGTDPDKAAEHQDAADRLLPQPVDAYCLRGMTAQSSQEAIQWLSKALELDASHYPSRKARTLAFHTIRDYTKMLDDAEAMLVTRPKDFVGYALRAIAKREQGQLEEAIEDHGRAIASCDVEAERAELYDQRRQTYVRMGNYDAALGDAQRAMELDPEESGYRFNVLTAMLSMGDFRAAQYFYGRAVKDDSHRQLQFAARARRYAFEVLGAGRALELPDTMVAEEPFATLRAAVEQYRLCQSRARPLVPFACGQASWSPDGRQLAYGRLDRDIVEYARSIAEAPCLCESSGIEILDLETGRVELLVSYGTDPAWSPDGRWIAFQRGMRRGSDEAMAALWIVPAAGGQARYLTHGSRPVWAKDSRRLFFHSSVPAGGALCCIPIDGPRDGPGRVIACPAECSAIAPDEKQFAYAVSDTVYLVEMGSGAVTAIWKAPPPEGGQGMRLRWAPNGEEILVAGTGESRLGLWSYDVERRAAWQIFPAPAVLANVSPDGAAMAVALHERFGGIWLAELDPSRRIHEAMAASQTRGEYLRRNCRCYAQAIKAGTSRSDAGEYLGEFVAAMRELGETCYHGAAYEEALETLTALADLLDALGGGPSLPDIALAAMSLHWVGREQEANAALERLERLCRTGAQAGDRRLLYEAQKVFVGRSSRLYTIWEHAAAGRLREAARLLEDVRLSSLDSGRDDPRRVDGASPGEEDQTAARIEKAGEILANACHEHGAQCKHDGGTYRDAMADYEAAVRANPHHIPALIDLAWLQAACPATELRDPVAAVHNATEACELTMWRDHRCVAALAALSAQAGDFEAAVKWQRKATDLLSLDDARDNRERVEGSSMGEQAQWLNEYQSRLALYESERRYDKGHLWSFSTGRMLGWWQFDEERTDRIEDRSGNGCLGRLIGRRRWLWSPSRADGAVKLSGTDNHVVISGERTFDITGQITVAAWVKARTFDSEWQAIVTKGDTAWRLQRFGDTANMEFACNGLDVEGSNWSTVRGNMELKDRTWYHLTGVYDGARLALYVDGVLDVSVPASGAVATNDFDVVIGGNAERQGRGWNGMIDDVRIYSYALSAAEIQALYAAGRDPSQVVAAQRTVSRQ